MATKTVKLRGRRSWAGYSLPGAPGWSRPEGGDGDTACPRERSMNSVRLRGEDDSQSRRRDQGRERNQRKLFWYIQWSRDWRVRQMSAAVSIQPEKARRFGMQLEPQDEETQEQAASVWSWAEYRRARQALKRKGGVPKRLSALARWLATLNHDKSGEHLH